MPIANISINAVDGSNDDLPINTLVQLNNQNIGGETTFLWSIVDQPPGTADALSSTSIVNPTFTPKKEGSYLIRLVVNSGTGTESTDQVIAAIRHLKTRQRVPAAGETTEVSTSQGWGGTTGASSFLRLVDTMRADPGVIVGTTAAAGIVRGDVLKCTNVSTIKSGLPGQEIVPSFNKALATAAANVDELLGVCEGGIDGSASPANGALIYLRIFGLYSQTVTGVPAAGDPVFCSNTATLALAAGTATRKIGTAIAPAAGVYRVMVFGGVVD